ncbi:MAG: aromatic-ring-hydroxylating dioxygenase subunit beta [Beijerinckiaceae bacterium]|nr:aromatic-ring-hydroxylating dioxygenase subunit beta [Beijerinckiaceae bacterium]
MSAATMANVSVTRAEVEDFLYHEAMLLDDWRLKEWEELLADDATYYIPANDDLDGDFKSSLYIISDDRERIRQRIIRVLDPNCHAEFPRSRLCRLITNVRITGVEGDIVKVAANFSCYRYRRYQREFVYVGKYEYQLRKRGNSFKIKERRVLLAAHELGQLGSVSFVL